MLVPRSSRVRATAPFTAFIVVLLVLPLLPWAVISAEDAPTTEEAPAVAMDPTATEEPAAPSLVATEPPPPSPTPTPSPTATQPPPATEPPATEPPAVVETELVDPPEVEPSVVTTEEPVEPDATEASAEETPEPTVAGSEAPEGSPEATSTDDDLEEIGEMSLLALPHGDGVLTLNGQTDLVFLNTSTSLNFHVPDIANLAALFPVSGGYAMSTTITEYHENWGCYQGAFRYHEHHGPYPNYTWEMTLPPRSPGLYSFQASVYVSDLHGKRLASGRTQCIDVSVSSSSGTPFLLVNGSSGPIVADDATQLTFSAGNLPAEATRHQLIRSTSPDCSSPSLVANLAPGVVASHTTYDSVPGVRWYQVRSHNATGFPLAKTPCVQVEIRTAVATLQINSEPVEVSVIEGQSVNLFATGLPPGQMVNLIYFPAAGCAGSSFVDPTSPYTVSAAGQVDRSSALYAAGRESISVLFRTPTRDTNCVTIRFLANEAELLVNGSRGPISVVLGDELHLVATGLPPGVGAYPAFGCDLSDPPDDLPGTVGQDGRIEFFLSDGYPEDAFGVRVRLEAPSTAATNCVFVQFFDVEVDPALTINGSSSQATVLLNEAYAIAGTGLPPRTRVTLARYDDSADCTGDATSVEAETTEEGTVETTGSRTQAGTWSYRVLTPRGDSNCVAVRAIGEPVLTVNGSSGPLSVMVGTTLNLDVSGWPAGAGSGLLREISLGEFCESPPWSLFPVGVAGADGTSTHAIPTVDSMVGTRSYRISGEFDIGGSTVSLITNCVTVTVEGWSPLVTVNGSAGPLEVTTTMLLTVEVSNLPDTAYQARLYPGRTGSDCSGVPMSSNLHPRAPGQETISVGYPPLPNPLEVPFAYSFNAQIHYRSDTGEERLLWSNCVLVVVDDDAVIVDPPTEPATEAPTEPSTEVPTEPVTEEPTDPVTLEPTDPATVQPTDPTTVEPTEPATAEPTGAVTMEPSEPVTEESTGGPTGPVTIAPTGGSNGSTPPAGESNGDGVTTGGLQPGQLAENGDAAVSRLPVTGATGGTARSLFALLALAAVLFAAAGSVVSRGGRRG